MVGILRIAYKLLVNDKGKFAALLMGLTFSVFLMIQVTSMFAGMMKKASATVTNTGAKVWVMDPAVTNVSSAIPMPDYVLDAVRSIAGRQVRGPVVFGRGARASRSDGTYQPVTVLGLDDTSLYGRPALIEGNIEDIYAENGFVVVKDEEFPKLENPKIGTEFELNDNRGVIVGIAKVPASGLFGIPTLYTTFNRAIQYIPSMRYTISFILVEPQNAGGHPAHPARRSLASATTTLTEEGLIDRITNWYMFQTGMGINLLLMTAISFIVGLSISGQTFYTFVLENIEKFGALKAIGAKRRELVAMIFFQAGAHRRRGLRPGHRALRGSHRAREAAHARLRVDHHLSTTSCWRSAWCSSSRRSPATSRSAKSCGSTHTTSSEADDGRASRSEAEGLTKWFGQGEARTCAVRDVTLRGALPRDALHRRPLGQRQDDAPQHHLRNPAARLRHGAASRARTCGRSTENALADFRLNKIGFVFQDFHLFPNLTTAENVAIPLVLKRRDWDDAIAKPRSTSTSSASRARAELHPRQLERRRAAARRDRARARERARPDDLRRADGVARRRHGQQDRRVREDAKC